jgi:hypothetical protein
VYLTRLTFLSAAVVRVAAPHDAGQAIDTQRSWIRIHVGKAGLLAAGMNTVSTRRSQVERLMR